MFMVIDDQSGESVWCYQSAANSGLEWPGPEDSLAANGMLICTVRYVYCASVEFFCPISRAHWVQIAFDGRCAESLISCYEGGGGVGVIRV